MTFRDFQIAVKAAGAVRHQNTAGVSTYYNACEVIVGEWAQGEGIVYAEPSPYEAAS